MKKEKRKLYLEAEGKEGEIGRRGSLLSLEKGDSLLPNEIFVATRGYCTQEKRISTRGERGGASALHLKQHPGGASSLRGKRGGGKKG